MKLDEKAIEKLVEEVLQEKSVRITKQDLKKVGNLDNKLGTTTKNRPFASDKYKRVTGQLRDLDTTKTTGNYLDDNDIQIAAKKGTGDEYDLAKFLADLPVHKSAWARYFRDQHDDVDKEKLAALGTQKQSELPADEQPFSQPSMYTQKAASGKFGGAILQSFNMLFGGASTLKERVEMLNKASAAAMGVDNKSIQSVVGADLRKQLNLAICLDYINAFAKNMDHGAGAYFFEAFVALITSGKVEGKAMGGEDQIMVTTGGKELSGSTKYLGSKKSEQATSTFPKSTPVSYVVAYKKDHTGSGTTGGISDPDKIVAMDLYVFTVTLTDDTDENGVSAQGNGKAKLIAKDASGRYTQIELNVADEVPTATLYLAKEKGGTFKESLENQINTNDKQMQNSFKLMRQYFQETYKANTLAKKYLSADKPKDAKDAGTKSLKAMTDADGFLTQMFNQLKVGVTGQKDVQTFDTTKTDRTLEESKFADLDKLILEVLKENT